MFAANAPDRPWVLQTVLQGAWNSGKSWGMCSKHCNSSYKHMLVGHSWSTFEFELALQVTW